MHTHAIIHTHKYSHRCCQRRKRKNGKERKKVNKNGKKKERKVKNKDK